jgi:hypothetical protein
MGEARQRRERGEIERKRFEPGPRLTSKGWVWLAADGHVYRLVRGRRIEDSAFRLDVQAAAVRTDSRIVRPSGDDVLRMAAEAARK